MARYHSLVGRGKILDRRNGGEADADAAAAADSPQVSKVLDLCYYDCSCKNYSSRTQALTLFYSAFFCFCHDEIMFELIKQNTKR